MQADLVIYFILFFFKILFCSSVCISLSVSSVAAACFDPSGHSLLFGWEQGSLLTWFPRSLSSRLRSRARLRLFSPPPKKKPCELDWRSRNLDWLQDIFGKCHSGGFACVNLRGKRKKKKRLRFFSFPPFRLQSLPPLWMPFLFSPPPSPFVFLQIVLTSEKAGSTWLSVPDLPAHFPLFFSAIQ